MARLRRDLDRRVQKSPRGPGSFNGAALNSVSCVTVSECVAVGFRFDPKTKPSRQTTHNLAEEWNGTDWRIQATPAFVVAPKR